MQPVRRVAYIIDDEQDVRVALSWELRAAGIESRPFASATDFLEELPHLQPGCILLDIRMPGKNGIDLLTELAEADIRWPAIMMTGHAEVITAVQAMKLGAIEFLEKPFPENALLAALERGFELLAAATARTCTRRRAQARFQALTVREREVLMGVAEGLSNKSIAIRLNLSHRTVEMHRSNLMKKLGVSSIVELLAMTAEAGVPIKYGNAPPASGGPCDGRSSPDVVMNGNGAATSSLMETATAFRSRRTDELRDAVS